MSQTQIKLTIRAISEFQRMIEELISADTRSSKAAARTVQFEKTDQS